MRFTTSYATDRGYFHEGREIDVLNPTPEHRELLRRGILIPVKDEAAEVALAPEDVERAVTRQTGRVQGRRPRGAAVKASTATEDD